MRLPLTNARTSKEMARLFVNNIVRLHGVPLNLVSDRGPQLASSFTTELNKILGTKSRMSTGYHPQTDGQTERANRVLEEMLRHYCNPDQDDWDLYLSLAEFAVNNAVHDSSGETPFFLKYGSHPSMPLSMNPTEDLYSKNPAAKGFAIDMQRALQRARRELERAQQRQKAYADQKRSDVQFKKGEEVLLSSPS